MKTVEYFMCEKSKKVFSTKEGAEASEKSYSDYYERKQAREQKEDNRVRDKEHIMELVEKYSKDYDAKISL